MRTRPFLLAACLLASGPTPLALAAPAAHAATTAAPYDFNGDGYRDLAIGVPGEALGGRDGAGGVEILYGRASGLSATGSQWFARNTTGVPGDLRSGEYFGSTVRLRDTNRDGKADLYVEGESGSLVLRGSSAGITTSGATAVAGDTVRGMLQ
ncbi:integrin alpha [Streptomyces acidicola]|uniref:integrin alpha n=1 Tax=Streptomyces acidicola TaxID=2596892 RepID=UPI00381D8E98